ncbi:MAG: hypothetical protein DRR16_08430 [Candidatus Parabeggiatoa sp. nov. 3]|jgi:hypothetical protein|nr:MAG: hypothetical protein DRR00_26175 [Gammaproteobacteria bacterium]RKZ86951.1 MAG: hypothetical protein DRR16_08430 [Gammaproteobacteria bacterium]
MYQYISILKTNKSKITDAFQSGRKINFALPEGRKINFALQAGRKINFALPEGLQDMLLVLHRLTDV